MALLTIAIFAVVLMLAAALVAGGYVRLSLQADVTKDSFWVALKLPKDVPYSETRRIAEKVERALLEVRDQLDKEARIRDPHIKQASSSGEAMLRNMRPDSGPSCHPRNENISW